MQRAGVSIVAALSGVPLVDPLLQLLFNPLSAEIDRRRSVALRSAEDLAGCSREELADRIGSNPLGVDRLIRVLYSAGMNRHDSILKMMGRTLVAGLAASEVGDSELLDREEALLITLEKVEPRHVRMLVVIEGSPEIANGALSKASKGWDEFPDLTASELLAFGLVDDPYGRWGDGPDASRFYSVSEVGALLLRAASEVDFRN